MEQHNGDVETKKDLMIYRLENAKSDLKSAKILFAAEEYKAANNSSRRIYSVN